MIAKYKLVLWIPVVGIVIVFLALYLPEIVGAHLELSYTDRTNIILTFAIMIFAAVEGYSTFLQVMLEDRRNLIEDARNELEKAYGPLYTLFNRPIETTTKTIELDEYEKARLDETLSTYPFMFSTEIFDLWRGKIRDSKSDSFMVSSGAGASKFPATVVHCYKIPWDFVEKIGKEYDDRLEKYNKLLKK